MKKKKVLLGFIVILSILSISVVTSGVKNPTYRALIVGNSNYAGEDILRGPTNDLVKMENSLNNNYFGEENNPFSKIDIRPDLTKSDMVKAIRETFSDAKEEDISYFYYSGHGMFNEYNNTSYLLGVDNLGLSVHELERELRNVPGKVVIILDSCNSGGFINKGRLAQSKSLERKPKNLVDHTEEYNDSILDTFSKKRSRSYLLGSKYKVITAASKREFSYEIDYIDGWGWGGEFTRAYVTGNGYNNKFLADSNDDSDITLNEIYNFTKNKVRESNVQVYPENDRYIIGSKFSHSSPEDNIFLDDIYDVNVSDDWEIKFNKELDDDSWVDKTYILDSRGDKLKTSVAKSTDGKRLIISSEEDFNYNDMYTIAIEKNILSKLGFRHNDTVLVRFFTEENVDKKMK